MWHHSYRIAKIYLFVLLMQWPCMQINAMLSGDTANGNSGNSGNSNQYLPSDCVTNSIETSLYCRGARAMRNIINNLSKTDKPIVIVRGLEIVPARKSRLDMANDTDNDTSTSTTYTPDIESSDQDTLIGRFSTYLRTHELNIKFSDLLAEESGRYLARDLMRNGIQINGSMLYSTSNDDITDSTANNISGINGADASEGKGKKEKGHGMMMMMAVMFSKLLAVMGMGGIGALALKALGVALVALLVAGIVGLRSIMANSYDSTPHVQYVQAEGHHHHRRRRSKNFGIVTIPNDMKHKKSDGYDIWNAQPLAYGGWHK